MRVLVAENIWWAFGAHLLHMKWGRMYAEAHGLGYYYRNNHYPVFSSGPETYYENPSTVTDADLAAAEEKIRYDYYGLKLRPMVSAARPEVSTRIMRQIYQLKPLVSDYLSQSLILQRCACCRYLALHVRRGDKTDGPVHEVPAISLETHLDACAHVRDQTGDTNLVFCCDTEDTVRDIERLNREKYHFELAYAQIYRPPDEWQHAVTNQVMQGRLAGPAAQRMYLDCFVDFEILLRSHVLIGDFNSGFSLAAMEIRRKAEDVNVSATVPIWGSVHR